MYYVEYIDFCTPKRKEFKTKKEAQNFINDFNKKMPNKDDYWIDAFYKGKIEKVILADDSWDKHFERVNK
jgi:hypothetical protein